MSGTELEKWASTLSLGIISLEEYLGTEHFFGVPAASSSDKERERLADKASSAFVRWGLGRIAIAGGEALAQQLASENKGSRSRFNDLPHLRLSR